MVQIIWMYWGSHKRCRTEPMSEVLRLLWSSYPDAYISFKEFRKGFGDALSGRKLEKMYNFFSEAVGEFKEYVEPRSLQHLCRCTVRKTLAEKKIWIPEGVSQTGLAKPLQSFVNLEKNCFQLEV
ncbi:unnamed protein product [Larinioides sclopetarius]|uniref:SOCS box domain-containing protein n=1 Tax=Larinioides sclopetarius TaxID=280406 RepID=A0AAV2AVQ7_9ARAC